MQYNIGLDDRMFPVTKSYLYREMQRGCQETGVKRIRIHDLRHSHISLLIDQGFSAATKVLILPTIMHICFLQSRQKWRIS